MLPGTEVGSTTMKRNKFLKRAAVTVGALSLLGAAAWANDFSQFPGASTDARTLDAQEQVESIYEAGEYKRALLIYQEELAPIGDKYAQYMVGYMHLNGQGVEKSRPRALAWYRLAAERRDPAILQARDALFHQMSQEEIVESNRIFVGLWRELGDNKLVLDLIRQDLKALQSRTGSRIANSGASPITVIDVRHGESSGDAFYDRIRKRVAMRMDYLDSNVEIVDLELGDELAVKKSLEMEIREEMAALDMR